MAAKPEADRRFGRSEADGTPRNGAGIDKVDALVSDFLEQLESISSVIKPIERSEVAEEAPAGVVVIPEAIPSVIVPPIQHAEEVRSDANLDLTAINAEIEETLAELERQKAASPSDSSPQVARPEPPPPAKATAKPVAESAPSRSTKHAVATAIHKTEDQEWKRIDIFRNEYVSSRSSRRNRSLLVALAAIVLAGILIYFFFLRSSEVAVTLNLAGQVSDSGSTN